jgi:hypothetical protein
MIGILGVINQRSCYRASRQQRAYRERLKGRNEAAVQQTAAAQAMVERLEQHGQAMVRACERLEGLRTYLLRPRQSGVVHHLWTRLSNPRWTRRWQYCAEVQARDDIDLGATGKGRLNSGAFYQRS